MTQTTNTNKLTKYPMNGKIIWFDPDYKMVGDGNRIKVWSTNLTEVKLGDTSISIYFTYDNDRFEIKLVLGNPDIFNGKIVCNGEIIGSLATKRFASTGAIILDGSYNVLKDGNYGCLIEISGII